VARLSTAHTADLVPDTPKAARALLEGVLEDVFDADWTARDRDHALGGIHARVR